MAPPPLHSSLRTVWRGYLAGDPQARERFAAAMGVEWSPAWRDALGATFEMLDGWKEMIGRSDDAARRVVDVLVEAVERGRDDIAYAPDHPRRSMLARDLAELVVLPPSVFVPLVPSLLGRIAEELPHAAPTVRSLRTAVVQLAGPASGPVATAPVPAVPAPDAAFGPDEETEDIAKETAPQRLLAGGAAAELEWLAAFQDPVVTPDVMTPVTGAPRVPVPVPSPAASHEEPTAAPTDGDALVLATDGLDLLHLSTIQGLVIRRWEEVLAGWVMAWERDRIGRVLGEIAVTFLRKRETVRRLRSLLGVELDYLSVRGDWGEGIWAPGSWEALERYAAMAESNPSLRRLAEMLGRLEAERARTEALAVPSAPTQPRRVAHRRGTTELRGVHFSADIDKLTTGEIGLLATPELEHVFYMKLLDAQLLTYEQRGADVPTPEVALVRAPPPRAPERRGPIILCIDTSASMTGEPELIAKTMALAVLRVALKERRACWVISYSHTADLREQDLTRLPEALGELVQFLSMSFRGGTDPVPALQAAIRRLEATEFDRADVLWITDGRFTVPEACTQSVLALRATRPFRIHMLLVAPAEVPEIVDSCWEWREGRSFDAGALELLSRL